MSSKTLLKLKIIGLLIALIFLGGFSIGFGALNEELIFQGKLQNSDGTNVADGAYNMVFKIYTQAEGGTAIYTETWNSSTTFSSTVNDTTPPQTTDTYPLEFTYTDDTSESTLKEGQTLYNLTKGDRVEITSGGSCSQAVDTTNNTICITKVGVNWENGDTITTKPMVKDGIFSVRIGSLDPVNNNLFTAISSYLNQDLWLGVQIGTDSEMRPRKKLGSVPWALASAKLAGQYGETIDNATDDLIRLIGSGGTDDTDLYINLDGTYPTLYSNTDTQIGIDDDLIFVGAKTITTSSGDLTIDPAGDLVVKGSTSDSTAAALNVQDSSGNSLFYVRNDGKIGIGTTNPAWGVHVYGPSGSGRAKITMEDDENFIQMYAADISYIRSDTHMYIWGDDGPITLRSDTGSIKLWTDNGTLVLSQAGRVGIGTASPGWPLHVYSNTGVYEVAIQDDENSNGSPQLRFLKSRSNNPANVDDPIGSINFDFKDSGGNWEPGAQIVGYVRDITNGSEDTELQFLTQENGVLAPAMTILNNGNVGIGTTAPTSKLDVAGTAQLRGAAGGVGLYVDSSGNVGIGTTSPSVALDVVGYVKSSLGYQIPGYTIITDSGRIRATSGNVTGPSFTFLGDTDTGFYNPASDSLGIVTGGVERIRITSGGRVGIGVTNPSSILTIGGDRVLTFTGGSASITAGTNYLTLTGQPIRLNANNIRIPSDVGGGRVNIVGTDNSLPAVAIKRASSTSSKTLISIRDENNTETLGISSDGGFSTNDGNNGILRFVFSHVIAPSSADGDGVGINFQTENASGVMNDIGYIDYAYDDILNGKVSIRVSVRNGTSNDSSDIHEVVRIDSEGNVGIGTTVPGAKLDISPSSSSETVFRTKSLQSTAPLGDELITNGTFDTDLSGWSIGGTGSGWSWSSGTALHSTGNTDTLYQNISVTDGTTYQVEFTISGRTAGSITIDVGGVYIYNSGSSTSFSSNTTYKRTFVASGTGSQAFTITPTSDFDGAVDNITVKPITGVSQPNAVFLNENGSVTIEIRGDGLGNTSLGINAGRYITTGYYNTFLGYHAGRVNTTGSSNTFVGRLAGYSNTTGGGNTFLGTGAGYSNTTGYSNIFVGNNSGSYNTTGSSNTFVGHSAGYYSQTGIGNLFLGHQSGRGTTTYTGSDYNTILGYQAGYNISSNQDYNVFLGYRAGYSETGSNKLYIAKGNNSALIWGDFATGEVGLGGTTAHTNPFVYIDSSGNVGIGTTGPDTKLDILSTSGAQLRLTYTDGSVYTDFTTDSAGDLTIAPSGGDTNITGNLTVSGNITSSSGTSSLTNLTVTGDLAVNGNTTLGDASGDTLTFNASTLSIPNNLNIDSNTLYIDATNNRVGIGTGSPGALLHVAADGGSMPSNLGEVVISDNSGIYDSVALSLIAGTSGSSVIQFGDADDSDVGWLRYSHSQNSLTFRTNANTQMIIDSSGNVGIGTTSPQYKLDVNTNEVRFGDGGGAAAIQFNATTRGDLKIGSGTTVLSLTNAGNVGIGTTAPTQKLEVSGNIKFGDNLLIGGGSFRVYKNLVNAYVGQSPTGAIIINTNYPWNDNCMFKVRIDGYNYNSNSLFRIEIGAYMYNNNLFYNKGYESVSSFKPTIRLGRNSNTNTIAIILGEETDSWSYPQLIVSEFWAGVGCSTDDSYYDGWSVTTSTDLATDGYDYLTTIPETTVLSGLVRSTVSGNSYFTGGNVGIGTTNPTSPLEVTGDIRLTNHGDKIWLGNGSYLTYNTFYANSTSGLTLYSDDSDPSYSKIIFKTNDTEQMRITSAGNVGIGTTNPQAKLDISGTGVDFIIGDESSTYSALRILGSNTDDYAYIQAGTSNTDTTAKLRISRYQTGTSPLANFQIYSDITYFSGSVGIGTTAPTQELHVVGDILFTGGLITNAGTTAVTDSGRIRASDGTASTPGFTFNNDTDVGIYRPLADSLSIVTGGVERIWITSTGSVGIGTTNPGSYKLNVAGDQYISGTLTVATSGSSFTGTVSVGTLNATSSIQTNGTTRIDSSGNLTNIGNITGTGAITISAGGSAALTLDSGSGYIVLNDNLYFEKGTYDLTLAVTAPTGASRNLTIPALGADANVAAYSGTLSSGDILYGGTNNVFNRLAIGANNYVLISNGSQPTWAQITGSNIQPDSLDFTEFVDAMTLDNNLTIDPTASNFSINIDSGTLYVNTANNRIGINTNSPGSTLSVAGGAVIGSDISGASISDGYLAVDTRLGIGTTVPGSTLQVAGTSYFSVLSTPTGVSATATSGGSLAAGTYYYVVVAYDNNGLSSGKSTEVSCTVDGSSTTACEISWNAVDGAGYYRVFGRSSGAQNQYWQTSSTTFTDTGSGGTAGTPPSYATSAYFAGNVGVGTWEPSAKLDIQGGNIELESGYGIGTSNYPNTLTFSSTGSVGIGTTNPGIYKLYVAGDQYISGTLTVATTGSQFTGTVTVGTLNATSEIQTDGTTRIDSSGNLTNIGNITGTGGMTIQSGGAGSLTLDSGSNSIIIAQNDNLYFERGTYDLILSVSAPTGASRNLTIPALGADANVAAYSGTLSSGDILYGGTNNVFNRLGIGANNYVLVSNGSQPTWAQITGSNIQPDSLDFTEFVDSMTLDNNLTIDPTASNFSINIDSGTLYVNTADDRIGINTNSPGSTLSVAGGAVIGSDISGASISDGYLAVDTRLGIGTTVPGSTLQVAGTSYFSVLSTPTGVSATPTSGGSLSSGTYYYVVVAYDNNGLSSGQSTEVSCTVDGSSTNACQISWNAVNGAGYYRVFGRSSGAQNQYWQTSSTTFTDTGSGGTAGTPPSYATSAYFAGNVGVGTLTPNDKLEVAGGIRVDDYIRARDSGGLALKTDEGTTRLFVADTGYVGIGTTNPQQKLHVEGQCITGDSLLSIIPAEKINQLASVEEAHGSWLIAHRELKPIKDVKPGDYVLSLNQQTNKIEPHKIKALLDMGVKPVFRLTTESGKSIRTTGNHPYLAIKNPRSNPESYEVRGCPESKVVLDEIRNSKQIQNSNTQNSKPNPYHLTEEYEFKDTKFLWQIKNSSQNREEKNRESSSLVSNLAMLDMNNFDNIGPNKNKLNPVISHSQPEFFKPSSFKLFNFSVLKGMIELADLFDFSDNSNLFFDRQTGKLFFRTRMKEISKHKNNYLEDFIRFFNRLSTSLPGIQEFSRSASLTRFSVSLIASGEDHSIKSTISSNNSLERTLDGANTPRRFLSSMIVNGNGFGLAIQSNDNKKDNKLSNANLWQIKTSLKGEKTIQVFGFSGFDFGNQDAFSIFPVKNYSPISDSKPVNFNSFSSSDEFSELERGGLSQIKFQFFNNPLLFSFGEFFQFLSRFLGEVMTNHNPNSFLTFLPLTLPDLRDSSISFQNSGFEYSILSNKSSVASKNRLITSAGTPFVEPDLFERVNLPIHSYDNKKDNKLSNAKWIKVIYLKPGDEIAVLNNSGEVVFEKIKSIEFIGYEHVYDIAVEGTHNFVANGILAHNTYISGNVGIGTTSPEELLHLYGADKNFKLTDTAIATRHVTLGIGNNPLGAGYPGVIFNTVVESGNQMGYVFQVEGSTKLVIDKDGNVGIGTTEPGAKLDIRYSGDGNFIRIANTYNDIGVRLGFDGNRPFLQTWQPSTGNDNSWSIALQPNGGNVGIGTTGPSSKLDITASDYNLLRLERASIATYGIYITDIGAGAAQLDFAALTNNTGFIFRSKDSGGAEINALFIKPDGNVGIGTTAPGAKLDIADAGSAAGSKFVLIGDDSFLTDIDVANTLGVYGNQNSTVASIKLGSGGGTISGYNGNIGIGTTAPNEKLEVVGDIRMEGGSGFGDLLFTDGTAYGTNRYSGQISLLASLKGRLLNYNPSFCMGTYEYSVYDNSHSGKVTITTVDDTTSPSVCGKILKVSYDGTGTPGSQPTPGYGGFYIAVTKCNGAATEDCYIEGNRYVYRIWAKIPSGRSINFASNPYGTGSSFRWISSTAGTGTWEQYIGVQKIGEGGTFSSTGFFYISSGDNVAFDWYVANVEVIGIDEPASVDLTKSLNVGFKTGVNLGSGNLLTASGTYLAVDSGNVGIGTTNPSYKLDVSGDIRATNVVYANTGVQAGWFKASSDGVKIYPSGYTANPGLLVYTGNGSSWVERMRITGNASTANVSFTNSNVGIGTTAPSAKLEIAKVAGAASKDALRIGIDGEYDARIKFFDDDDEAGQYAQIIYGAGSNKFYLYNKGAGITIDSAGNVGIGTTSPGTLLEIEGSSGGGSLTKIKTTDIWDSSHAEDLLIIDGGSATDANTGGYFGIRMQSGVNANKAVGLYAVSESSWSNYVGLAIYTWNDANYREVVRIRGSGNVGIGTTNPGYKLDVAGTGRFTSNLTVGGNLTVSGGKINNRSISTFSTVVWKNSPAAYSLTRDNAWHDLDVTSVTSANTRAVILSIYMYRGGGGGEMYCFTRRNGSTASYEGLVRSNPIAEQTGTAHIGGVVVQGTDSGQVFEYKCYTDVSSATLQVLGYIEYATGADLAEVYYVDEGEEVEAGDVVVTGSSGERVRKSSKPYQKEVIGVVSTKPGLVIGEEPTGIDIDTDRIAVVALAGRVPVKVSTENGPIEVGDWLTPSSKPGVAMKATGPGPVIGKALEAYDNPNPDETGKILMFVSLGWYGGNDPIPEVTININGELYTGTGEELDESSNIFVQLVKQALGVLGATIENGIVQLKELVAEKIFAKEIKVEKVRFEKIEMVDQETGQVWCLWIENGEWRKVNTECDNLPFEVTPVEESVLSEPESQSENSSEEISESEDLLSDQENTTEVISSGGGGGSADENQIDQTQDINGQSSDTSTTESETIDTQTNDTQQTTEAQSTENQLIEDQSTVENGGESNSLQETTQETIQDTTSSEEINENSQDSTLELSSDTQSNKEGLASENENTIFTEEQSADQLETQSDTSSEGGDTVLETQSTESQSTEAQSATFQSTNTTETTETTETTTQTTDIQSENSQIESSGQSVDTQSSDTQASNDRSSDSQPTNNQATETSSAKTSSPDNSSAESSSTETPPTSGDSTSSPTTQ